MTITKPSLNAFILDCLRGIEKKEKDTKERFERKGWDVLADDNFMCRLCKKHRHNDLRSKERVGFCRYCMGE